MATRTNAPKDYDIEAYRGDTLSLPFQARNKAGIVDLTGYTIIAQVRKKRQSAEPSATFTVFVEDAAQGLYTLVMPASVMATLPCGETPNSADSKYVWDVQLTKDGVTTTPHAGAFVVIADVSRSS